MTETEPHALSPEARELARQTARRQFFQFVLNRDSEAVERYFNDLRSFQASVAEGQIRELANGAIEALAAALNRIDDLLAAIINTPEP